MDLAVWLRSLGLEQYEATFRNNAITEKLLPSLTAEDLKDLGVSVVGHRRALLNAIADLRSDRNAPEAPSAVFETRTAPPKDTAAERRQVTVVFSDLVGSTALSGRMDPEDLREIISAYQKCVTDAVQRFGGFVAKYMGDGVLVYFGYPHAHEDDAERAVRAALELVVAVSGSEDVCGTADARRYRNRTGGRGRSDRFGIFSGASHRRRDSQPCRASASHCGAKQRRNCREHSEARGQSVRASGPGSSGTQRASLQRCKPGRCYDRLQSKAASTLSTLAV